jgi:hypothetical protein|eukprot:COSAG01_NODE_798_length_13503_cov_8.878395_5_plen_51_part_00
MTDIHQHYLEAPICIRVYKKTRGACGLTCRASHSGTQGIRLMIDLEACES